MNVAVQHWSEGPIPSSWRLVELGQIAQINPRRPQISRGTDQATTFVPMPAVDEARGEITAAEVRPFSEVQKGYTYFQNGDVLFAKITPCMENGKHAIARDLIGDLGFGSTEFHVIRPSDHLSAEWVHWYVRQPDILRAAKASFTGAVGQQRVPPEFLRSLQIPLPPVWEQRRIAAVLDAQMAEVARARAAARVQNQSIGRMASATVDAWIGKFGSQWPLRSIASCVETFRNGLARRPNGDEDGPIVLRISDVSTGVINLSNPRRMYLSDEGAGAFSIAENDILFIRVNGSLDLVGRAIIVPIVSETICFSDHLIRARLRADVVPEFFCTIVNHWTAREQIEAAAVTSAGQKTVNQTMFNSVLVPVPSKKEQLLICEALRKTADLTRKAESALIRRETALDALPPALLRAAFRGDI